MEKEAKNDGRVEDTEKESSLIRRVRMLKGEKEGDQEHRWRN